MSAFHEGRCRQAAALNGQAGAGLSFHVCAGLVSLPGYFEVELLSLSYCDNCVRLFQSPQKADDRVRFCALSAHE
jgi:hypothetical protein